MTGPFDELLAELGQELHLVLHIDQSDACSIFFPPEITIQLQLDQSQENLLLFCKIAEIPPGKFRENVLMQALKANALPDPLPGTLGFLNATNHLALYQSYPRFILNGERLALFLTNFFQLAENWRLALSQGKMGPDLPVTSTTTLHNPFGLRP